MVQPRNVHIDPLSVLLERVQQGAFELLALVVVVVKECDIALAEEFVLL